MSEKRNLGGDDGPVRGDDYSHAIFFVEDDETTPIDKSGYTYKAQIRKAKNDPDATDITVDLASINEGIVVLRLTEEQTRALPAVGVWDLEETAPGGNVTTLLDGAVIVKDDVTR